MADIDAPLSWRMQQDGYLMQIDQLRTENANIRDGFHVMQQLYEDELKHALEENTELRELVKDYYSFAYAGCFSCRYYEECHDQSEWRCIAPIRLAERTRDLGIGVSA